MDLRHMVVGARVSVTVSSGRNTREDGIIVGIYEEGAMVMFDTWERGHNGNALFEYDAPMGKGSAHWWYDGHMVTLDFILLLPPNPIFANLLT